MHYCMNRGQLRQLVDYKACGRRIEDEELSTRLEFAEAWQDELGCLTYLFSMVLERRTREGTDCTVLIDLVYGLEDQMSFRIQEVDSNFVSYMMRNTRTTGLSIEDELVGIQNRIGDYEYGRAFRG